MELAFITLRFDTPGEQLFVEESVNFSVWEHETWPAGDRNYMSWTEFDISGCEPKDLHIFDEVIDSWDRKTEEEKEVFEEAARKRVAE